jgi:hypothetical protein
MNSKLVMTGALAIVAVLAVAAMLPLATGQANAFLNFKSEQNNHQSCHKATCGQVNQNNQFGDNTIHGGGINFGGH